MFLTVYNRTVSLIYPSNFLSVFHGSLLCVSDTAGLTLTRENDEADFSILLYGAFYVYCLLCSGCQTHAAAFTLQYLFVGNAAWIMRRYWIWKVQENRRLQHYWRGSEGQKVSRGGRGGAGGVHGDGEGGAHSPDLEYKHMR